MINEKAKKIYRTLLFLCAVYFIAVTIAHQMGTKLPMLFVFFNIPSERYQDLIISFLSFGWAMLFGIGFMDNELKPGVQVPILISGIAAICGLIRARMEIQFHDEINYEIIALTVLLLYHDDGVYFSGNKEKEDVDHAKTFNMAHSLGGDTIKWIRKYMC